VGPPAEREAGSHSGPWTHRAATAPGDPDPRALTDREREVLELLAAGLDNRTIARRLQLGEKTVRSYVSNILTKLHVTSRYDAADLAREAGVGQEVRAIGVTAGGSSRPTCSSGPTRRRGSRPGPCCCSPIRGGLRVRFRSAAFVAPDRSLHPEEPPASAGTTS
jgi:DNA-binding CsgD family transcriptional regulator